jgi:hypothetical protein
MLKIDLLINPQHSIKQGKIVPKFVYKLLLPLICAGLFTIVPAAAQVDPAIQFSTYLGGIAPENGEDVVVDAHGYIYIAGNTHSENFPTANAVQDTLAGSSDVFIVKLDPAGTEIVYSTYLGGSNYDKAFSLAVDSDGHAYVTGYTLSNDFPTVNPIQSTFSGSDDTFIAKLSPSGSSLVYSTYLGGNGQDVGVGISVDSAGRAYVVGYTTSDDLPTHNPYQANLNNTSDSFVVSLNAAGTAFNYATYFGGGRGEGGFDVVADGIGNITFVGWTSSADFPVTNALQSAHTTPNCIPYNDRNCFDGFITQFNTSGIPILSTYLGGDGIDVPYGIALDANGNIYVSGETASTNFPTLNAYQPIRPGSHAAFLSKLNAQGSSLIYSTYLGGTTGHNVGIGVAVDDQGRAALSGYTYATDFPTLEPIQATKNGSSITNDAFITMFNPDGSALEFSTYLGGSEDEYNEFGSRLAFNQSGSNLFVIGTTFSDNFPVHNALQSEPGGGEVPIPFVHVNFDAFLAKLALPLLSPSAAQTELHYFTTDTPTLTWTPVTWATGYVVQVENSTTFSAPYAFAGDAEAHEYSITTTSLNNGVYYWRVAARKADGSLAAWSAVQSFTVDEQDT